MSSVVWKYYEKIDKQTSRCKLCFKNIKSSGNTTNLNKHLKQYPNVLTPSNITSGSGNRTTTIINKSNDNVNSDVDDSESTK